MSYNCFIIKEKEESFINQICINDITTDIYNERLKWIEGYGKEYRYARISNEGIIYYENEKRKQGIDSIQIDNRQTDISLPEMVGGEYARRNDFEKRKYNSSSSIKNFKTRLSLSVGNENLKGELDRIWQ